MKWFSFQVELIFFKFFILYFIYIFWWWLIKIIIINIFDFTRKNKLNFKHFYLYSINRKSPIPIPKKIPSNNSRIQVWRASRNWDYVWLLYQRWLLDRIFWGSPIPNPRDFSFWARSKFPGEWEFSKIWGFLSRDWGFLNLRIFIPGDRGCLKIWGFLSPKYLRDPKDLYSGDWGFFIPGFFGDGDFFSWDGISHQKATSSFIPNVIWKKMSFFQAELKWEKSKWSQN